MGRKLVLQYLILGYTGSHHKLQPISSLVLNHTSPRSDRESREMNVEQVCALLMSRQSTCLHVLQTPTELWVKSVLKEQESLVGYATSYAELV